MAKEEKKAMEATVDGTNVEVPVKDVTDAPAEPKEPEKAPEPEKKEKGKWKKRILSGLKIAGETIVCASAVLGATLGVKNAVDISRAKKNSATPALPGSGTDQIGEAGAPSFGGNPFDGSGNPF